MSVASGTEQLSVQRGRRLVVHRSHGIEYFRHSLEVAVDEVTTDALAEVASFGR
jgi:hypothetical protein